MTQRICYVLMLVVVIIVCILTTEKIHKMQTQLNQTSMELNLLKAYYKSHWQMYHIPVVVEPQKLEEVEENDE